VFSISIGSRFAPVLQAVLRRHARGDVPAVHDQSLGADRRGRLELLVQEFPARDPDPVVAGRDVDDVRRVNVDVDARRGEGVPDGGRVSAGYHRALPALRVAEEELGRVRAVGDRLVQRVVNVEVGSDARHVPSVPGGWGVVPPSWQSLAPACDNPGPAWRIPGYQPAGFAVRG
jgi:hypothetical protein